MIGPDATVGPFSYLRPGTRLERDAKVGAFVETKNVEVGEGSKVPHLSYVGDATIGRGANIGAATVFVNYDGVAKHRTTIGDQVRIGSDTMLVAPVTVGDGAYTAAGSVITSDVPRVPWPSHGRPSGMWQAGFAAAAPEPLRPRPRKRPRTGRRHLREAAPTPPGRTPSSRDSRADERDPAGEQQEPDALLRAGLPRTGRRDRGAPGGHPDPDRRLRVRQR
ncbi:DapH/DapD/GlmU-related protein [Blastococcus brunescens]|uniref:DapH/DapD/GlmU-related protein n=1 Tax=Blastococcus brunescens TaxID=1564165 RepID=A0ABZ1B6Q4_9ACTN|nr:DapH/DapD/GlmU-related protein [Blastococcus sp. BMG 8361]WRL64705.1 DapH/DapD/GlmU-related protein [Blastococcus sp. BMG 8361]